MISVTVYFDRQVRDNEGWAFRVEDGRSGPLDVEGCEAATLSEILEGFRDSGEVPEASFRLTVRDSTNGLPALLEIDVLSTDELARELLRQTSSHTTEVELCGENAITGWLAESEAAGDRGMVLAIETRGVEALASEWEAAIESRRAE